MKLATLDYETYYDQEYSLSKMSTEDYVCDPRFEVMLVGLKINDTPAIWHSGNKASVREFLWDNQINDCALLAQNTMFDQLINQHHFDIRPRILLDTMCMAQALIKPYVKSVSLDSILKYLTAKLHESGRVKGGYVAQMKGRRRESLSQEELHAYGGYCLDDVENEYWVFTQLRQQLPKNEFDIIDLTLRMYLDPQLELDSPLLSKILDKTRADKEALIAKLPEEVQRADLMSNVKLAKLLESLGVEIPRKISPTTGKSTYAFAKNDAAWMDMVEEYADDPIVAPILAARQSEKSTITETRCQRLLDISNRYRKFRVPLKYHAALNGRYGGTQSINAQNFNRVNPKLVNTDPALFTLGQNPPLDRRQIRFAIKAPKHHVVLAGDLAQIEARINAWLSGCTSLVNSFARGDDTYAEFASLIFQMEVRKGRNDKERFVGKTCILGLGYGMGAPKLQATLRKDKIKIDLATASNYVGMYRSELYEIPALWTFCNETLEILAHGGKRRIGPCLAVHNAIELPNGMKVVYNNLRWRESEDYVGWVYDYGGMTKTIWGGKVVENICSALAQVIIKDAMQALRRELGIVISMQAHDELVLCVLEKDAPTVAKQLEEIMSRKKVWAPDLPIAVETHWGATYGDAK